jgi:hypothetical protein
MKTERKVNMKMEMTMNIKMKMEMRRKRIIERTTQRNKTKWERTQ